MKVALLNILHFLEYNFDRLRFRFRKAMALISPPVIEPYFTYGSDKTVIVKGRVLEEKKLRAVKKRNSLLPNIRNMFTRFFSNEIPDCLISIQLNGESYKVVTDDEGYFFLKIPGIPVKESTSISSCKLNLEQAPVPVRKNNFSLGEILLPGNNCDFGVISDIDDTIMRTYATSWWRMLWLTFSGSAHSRLPFPGVSAWYRALEKGPSGKNRNPFFYVSSSPWNLYDLLMEFLHVKNIPKGPLLLKDYGIEKESLLSKGHMDHKFREIEMILDTYPELPFILIGDSGQKDPEVYRKIIHHFPTRISAVYIRDVNKGKADMEMVVADDGPDTKVPFLVVKDSYLASEDAQKRGFIPLSALEAIRKDKNFDHS